LKEMRGKKIEKEGKLRTEEMKKWTERAVTGIYKAGLPTDSPTEIKKYYFNLFHRWSFENLSVNFEFRTNVFNYPPYFPRFVGNFIDNLTRLEMHLMHRPLEFTQSVGDFVDNIDLSTTYWRTGIRRQHRRWLWHFK
jgi:hypothetical protein